MFTGRFLGLLFLCCVLTCCTVPKPAGNAETKEYSMVALIADPQKYNNRRIRTRGYVSLEFENTALYLSENDAKNYLSKNAIWLSSEVMDRHELQGRYAVVEGVFDSTKRGHLGQFSGTIRDIVRFEPNAE